MPLNKAQVNNTVKNYRENASYLHIHKNNEENKNIKLPDLNATREAVFEFYNDPNNEEAANQLQTWIEKDRKGVMLIQGKKLFIQHTQEDDTLKYYAPNGNEVTLTGDDFNQIKQRVKTNLSEKDAQTIWNEALKNGDVDPLTKNTTISNNHIMQGALSPERLYLYIENEQLKYKKPSKDSKAVVLPEKFDPLKKLVAEGTLLNNAQLEEILNFAAKKGDIKHKPIQAYNEEMATVSATAAIPYIYKDYFTENSDKIRVNKPTPDSSYSNAREFYKNPDNKEAALALSDWFEKNRPSVEEWYKTNKISYEERWSEVAKTALTERLTSEHMNSSNVNLSMTRLFNQDSLADILIPYKTYENMDKFLPTLKETGSMTEATKETVKNTADLFQKKFIETGILNEAVEPFKNNPSLLQELYPSTLHTPENFDTSPLINTFKKDLCASFLQPAGNYLAEEGVDNETLVGRKVAWNKMQDVVICSLGRQIEGIESIHKRGEILIKQGQNFIEMDMVDDGKKKIATGKRLQDNATKLLNAGVITQESQSFEQYISIMQAKPEEFKFIQEGDQTEKGMEEGLFKEKELKRENYVTEDKSLLQKAWSAAKSAFQWMADGLSQIAHQISNVFSSTPSNKSPVDNNTVSSHEQVADSSLPEESRRASEIEMPNNHQSIKSKKPQVSETEINRPRSWSPTSVSAIDSDSSLIKQFTKQHDPSQHTQQQDNDNLLKNTTDLSQLRTELEIKKPEAIRPIIDTDSSIHPTN